VLCGIFEAKKEEVTGSWNKLHEESQFLLFAIHYYYDQIKEDEMGRAHSTHAGDNECVHNLGYKARMEETTCKIKA
jgi:hypothetical protein